LALKLDAVIRILCLNVPLLIFETSSFFRIKQIESGFFKIQLNIKFNLRRHF
jgi:hypothetical protein